MTMIMMMMISLSQIIRQNMCELMQTKKEKLTVCGYNNKNLSPCFLS